MKTTTILTILLLGSVCYNIYQYQTCGATVVDPGNDKCITTGAYDSAIEIDNDIAKGFYEEFVATLVSPDSTTGGIISREAFDKMLCLDKCNGISYSFARDISGSTGPRGNGIFIVFQGVNVEYDAVTKTITAVNQIDGAKKYRSGNWCPVNCMAW